jgi:hypothetical protein
MTMETKMTDRLFDGVTAEAYDLYDFVLKRRQIRAFEDGVARYPILRELRFAARVEMDVLLDAIALDQAWRAERLLGGKLVLDADGVFVGIWASRKTDYCTFACFIWAADVALAEGVKQRLLDLVGSTRITEPTFSVDWTFVTSKGELESASIEEMADDKLHDRAYPEIKEGVQAFIARYLASPEAVLVLQGPPGTGKTRLIRAILGEMSRRKDGEACALYTGDLKALASDEIFVKFITGRHDAFVVEDADHALKPRADGNDNLHRFLTIADGVVRSQGRKIIFSTNLPNIGDLDDALVRPGRCFARVHVRALTGTEAQVLAAEIAGTDAQKSARVALAFAGNTERRSLAEVYKALQ